MEIQPQLVLLQKTLLNIEGLGRQIYPDLDLWNTAMPYLESWMRERNSPKALFNSLLTNGPDWLEQSHELPQLLLDTLQQPQHIKSLGEQQAHTVKLLQQQQTQHARNKRHNRVRSWLAVTAFSIAAIAAIAASQHSLSLEAIPTISWIFGIGGLALLISRR
ncbi:Ubiquinone biosynthesis monooxygenase UbiB [gamma proteobacterium IMCC2047]|nr:Ubiquinone biosynthesis monooxygenase UbiB [gamma proteobacterium IMCC2047]